MTRELEGKIYPCERIGNEFFFGEVTDDGVFVDFDGILNTYNGLFSKYIKKCNVCKLKDYCSVCIVSDIKGYEYCSQLKSKDIDEIISYFQDNPDRLTQTMTKISVK